MCGLFMAQEVESIFNINLSKNHICYYTFVNAEKIFNRGYA